MSSRRPKREALSYLSVSTQNPNRKCHSLVHVSFLSEIFEPFLFDVFDGWATQSPEEQYAVPKTEMVSRRVGLCSV